MRDGDLLRTPATAYAQIVGNLVYDSSDRWTKDTFTAFSQAALILYSNMEVLVTVSRTRVFAVCAIFCFMTGCVNRKSIEQSELKPIKILFLPSFLYALEVKIFDSDNPTASITVTMRNEHDSIDTLHSRSFHINPGEIQSLLNGIESFNKKYSGHHEDSGLDGISVFVTSERLQNNDTIEFWSPRRSTGSEFYDILDPVFSILQNHLNEEAEANYIEQLEQYFEFGFPVKLISKKLRKYRIYGVLSVDDKTSKLLKDFIEGVPSNEPVTIDMTNFEGMGTYYYYTFNKLLKKNPSIFWIANDRAYEQLTEMGVSLDRIERRNPKLLKDLSP